MGELETAESRKTAKNKEMVIAELKSQSCLVLSK